LSAPQHADALAVIERVARERNAVLGVGGRDWLWLGGHEDFMVAAEPRTGLWSGYWHYRDLSVPLLGTHQFENAGLAVAAARVIEEKRGTGSGDWRLEIQEDDIRRGLGSTKWAGRLEVLRERSESGPLIIADGAHNGDSAERLLEALKFHFEFDKLFLIVGVLGDKQLEAITMPFVLATESAWTVKTHHPRARDAQDAAIELRGMGIEAQAARDMGEALEKARQRASPRDLVLITGSLSAVAQARAAMGMAEIQDPVP
jgi:dihydrofolate synthase/folylpolyglutamate synthase